MPATWAATRIPNANCAIRINPATSRLAPETSCREDNSATARVIAAPGRKVANGGANARRLASAMCSRSAAVKATSDTVNAHRVGSSCCTASLRRASSHITPTMAPSTTAIRSVSGAGCRIRDNPALCTV